MADLNPLFYTTGPLVRLSKEFAVNGHSMASVMPRIHSFLLPAGFTTPKSSGALVKAALDGYQAHMARLQALRGYTDAEMRRNFVSNRDALWLGIDLDRGFSAYLRQCFIAVDPQLSVDIGEGFEPMVFLTHHQLGHRYVTLALTGEALEGVGMGRDGRPLPMPWEMGPTDRGLAFNDDRGSGFVRR